MVVNFVVVPLVVAAMFTFLPADQAVRLGVLLVLLCPCVDYVIVFSGLASGSNRRLLAATPVLLVAQMLLLPGFLYLFMGWELADVVEVGPYYVIFLVVMAFAGKAVARLIRLDSGAGRAIVFTGATRNSLVVLPLALAPPGDLAVAAVVVVTRTLVEVLGMVTFVRLVPRLVPGDAPAQAASL
ncbi:hypothetical protein GCM10010193_07040 [Kitasatospora atroaurantiaca]|uniref:Sodium bile acid symporter family protein n=1 Tax=Kitasatospora atroaurantiaca TaxID=285545 RepID=A0A561EJ76_9ACTN|nr:sodium bile acid symporter family protein [Kitasatospora atroaurantiaca]